MTPIKPQVSFC